MRLALHVVPREAENALVGPACSLRKGQADETKRNRCKGRFIAMRERLRFVKFAGATRRVSAIGLWHGRTDARKTVRSEAMQNKKALGLQSSNGNLSHPQERAMQR